MHRYLTGFSDKNSQPLVRLGVFLCLVFPSFQAFSQDQLYDLGSACYQGYSEHPSNETIVDEYVELGGQAKVQPAVAQWLQEQTWNDNYARWQRSLRCGFGLAKSAQYGDTELCNLRADAKGLAFDLNTQLTPQSVCSSKDASLNYLAMHKHLLQSVRSLWPELQEQFGAWMMLPPPEELPESEQSEFKAWPDQVRRDAMLLSSIRKMSDRELFSRWPEEGDLVHWMMCGEGDSAQSVDSLYSSLMSNLLKFNDPAADSTYDVLEQYLFWKIHAWLEMSWDMYRMRKYLTPLEPELQAKLIAQCELFEHLARYSDTGKAVNAASPLAPYFRNGKLNDKNVGKRIRLIGKVKEVTELADDQKIYRLELPLAGVEPVWVSAYQPFGNGEITIGNSYVFIAFVTRSDFLDKSGFLEQKIQSELLLMAYAIQLPK